MGKVEQIEAGVQTLSVDELAQFRDWFFEFEAKAWDARIDADAAAGRLDALIEEAKREFASGEAQEI